MTREEAKEIKDEIKKMRMAKCDRIGLAVGLALEVVMEIIDEHTEKEAKG